MSAIIKANFWDGNVQACQRLVSRAASHTLLQPTQVGLFRMRKCYVSQRTTIATYYSQTFIANDKSLYCKHQPSKNDLCYPGILLLLIMQKFITGCATLTSSKRWYLFMGLKATTKLSPSFPSTFTATALFWSTCQDSAYRSQW